LRARQTSEGIVLQSHGATCTAAALANIARQRGLVLDERGAVRLLGTTTGGTSPGQMRYALERLGIPFRMLNGRTLHLADVSSPAILFVDHPAVGREGHSVAYMGRAGDRFEIWDPLSGRELWSAADVEERWHGNGIECPERRSF
jgi:ABC-type bacteriocin/lantibiotic exporter with double-glycine peptidase domain